MTTENTKFDEWVIFEALGHIRVAGRLTEQEIAGTSFLRLDIPASVKVGDSEITATQYFSTGAVFRITPTTETIARKVAVSSQPSPVTAWELRQIEAPKPIMERLPDEDEGWGDDEDEDTEYGYGG